jgi:hypothetical protein
MALGGRPRLFFTGEVPPASPVSPNRSSRLTPNRLNNVSSLRSFSLGIEDPSPVSMSRANRLSPESGTSTSMGAGDEPLSVAPLRRSGDQERFRLLPTLESGLRALDSE